MSYAMKARAVGEVSLEYGKQAVEWTSSQVKSACNRIGEICQDPRKELPEQAKRIGNFVKNHWKEILFFGGAAVTAHFAPGLFFSGLAVAAISRIALTYVMKHYGKKEEAVEGAEKKSIFPKIHVPHALVEAAAAVDAFLLGTVFSSSSILVRALPFVGGLVAGERLGKGIYNGFERAHHDYKDAVERLLQETPIVEDTHLNPADQAV